MSRRAAALLAVVLGASPALAAPGAERLDEKVARRGGKPDAQADAKAAAPGLINLPETPAQLLLGPAWSAQELPQLPATSDAIGPARLVAFYREAQGGKRAGAPLALIVLRFDAPNPRAWRASQRAAYLDEIEASVLAACPAGAAECRAARRLKRSGFESEAVPGMDLQVRDAAGATRLFRFLFFRTYAILAAIEVAPRASSSTLTRARRALAGFTVEPNWQR